jgi:hypothetical protein
MADATLVLLPAFVFGAIIGLIEMMFVHSDEIGMGWFMHGLHALPFTILFVFINMNVGFALQFIPGGLTESFMVDVGVRAVVAVIGMIKIATAAAIAGRVGERFQHTIAIGCLIFAAPYAWSFIIAPMGLIPNWF